MFPVYVLQKKRVRDMRKKRMSVSGKSVNLASTDSEKSSKDRSVVNVRGIFKSFISNINLSLLAEAAVFVYGTSFEANDNC